MKKNIYIFILFTICIICLQSCTTTKLVGDITTYTQNGEEVKTWKDVTIQEQVVDTKTQSAFKMWGLNFYDKETDQFIIISNAVPYVIKYKAQKNTNSERKYPEWGTY